MEIYTENKIQAKKQFSIDGQMRESEPCLQYNPEKYIGIYE